MAETIKIGGELESRATGNKVADVANIKDKTQGDKSQAQINTEINTALADRYTKTETYSKTELDSMITTPDIDYKNYDTYAAMLVETNHPAGAIYRVANYDGTQAVTNKYAEYSWDGTQYKLMAVRDHGIDDEPTAGSDNLVKSGGVSKLCKSFVLKGKNNYSYINIPYVTSGYTYSILIKNKENIRDVSDKLEISYKSNDTYTTLVRVASGNPILDKYVVTIPEDVTNLEHIQIFTYIQPNTQIEITILEDKYDTTPTSESKNLVTSGGVKTFVDNHITEYNISDHHLNTFAPSDSSRYNTKVFTLEEAIQALPLTFHRGGIKITFNAAEDDGVVSTYRLNYRSWSTTTANWIKEGEIILSDFEFMTTQIGHRTDITKYGIRGYINPSTLVFNKSNYYRLIWVKCNAGDKINVYTFGYSDNITIAFNTVKSFDGLSNIQYNTSWQPQTKSSTAPSDGYFLVGGCVFANNVNYPIIVDCPNYDYGYIDIINPERGVLQHWDILSSNSTIRNQSPQYSYIYHVKKGDTLEVVNGKQFGDTSMLAFTTVFPQVGDTVTILEVGTNISGFIKSINHNFTQDGYAILTLYQNTYESFKLKTSDFAVYTEVEKINQSISDINQTTNELNQTTNELNQTTKLLSKSIGLIDYQVTPIFGKYLKIQNGAVSIDNLTSTTLCVTEPILIYANTTVELYHNFSYNDMAVIATCDENGDNLVLLLSSKGAQLIETNKYKSVFTFTEDTYVRFSFTSTPNYGIYLYTNIQNLIETPTLPIPNVFFQNIEATAAGEMSSWTASQIIENIYEPLRLAHPEYIKRRSLGKDASNTYDIWLYEFNNTVDEWFSSSNSINFSQNVILPGQSGLTLKQCAIPVSDFDNYFSNLNYKSIYFLMDYEVRKFETWIDKVEETINDIQYYKFTFNNDVKIVDENSVTIWWTSKVNTYDQHCMFISGIHGDESAGYLGVALALQYLVNNHANNPSLNYIYNRVKLSVIPCVNMWGGNQTPKVRSNSQGRGLNSFSDPDNLAAEQIIVRDYVESVKNELSIFIDFHTSELWKNYGFVYAIGTTESKLFPALTSAAGYLCKHWFPTMPPYNWNVGCLPTFNIGTNFIKNTYDIESATIEFCGLDLQHFGNCERWDAQYMKYCIENYVNFIISVCSARIKTNIDNVIKNTFFNHTTMA